jgi:O-antigen ligase
VKWLFLLGLLAFTPWLAAFLRANPKYLPHAGFAMGILPFLLSGLNLNASPIAWPYWSGAVKGFDVSLLDGIAVAVIFATKPVRTPAALKVALGIYFTGCIVATVAGSPGLRLASIFYDWQVVRAALVYMAVTRACVANPRVPVTILMGLGLGLGSQAIIALQENFGGKLQAGAWFGHQNLLGMASHFAVFPAIALLLAGYYGKQAAAIIASGMVVAFAGGSRATIGLFAIGMVITLILSIWRRSTGRKMAVAGGLLVLLVVAMPVLYTAIERRSDQVLNQSNLERTLMIKAAKMIIADHPLGIGPNRYIVVANAGGYSDRAGMAWNKANRSAPVHNTYYLVTAELGWIGLFGLLGIYGSLLAYGLSAIRSAPPGLHGEMLVGVMGTLIVIMAHSYYEWITMYFHIHYLLAISVGLLFGLRRTAALSQKKKARAVAVPRAELAPSGA